MTVVCLSLILSLGLRLVTGQVIDGCPMYGCRPSGTFSFTLDVPRSNASIGWVTDFFIGPVPDNGGCVGNPSALICQSNGPGPGDTGYMSVDVSSGSVRWRDLVLRFPTLPVLDTDGSIWGSDGSNLMQYDVDGRPETSNIPLQPTIRPIFGAQYVGSGIILLVSETGEIATWLSDGTPLASLYLNGTVERSNGTFLPVAPAVVKGSRVYVLTEFVPEIEMESPENLGLQRLYAIDVRATMADRMSIAWYANFEKERRQQASQALHYIPKSFKHYIGSKQYDLSVRKPSLLLDSAIETVYVSLPPPMSVPRPSEGSLSGDDRLVAVRDTGNDSAMVFTTSHSVQNMALYERNMGTNAGDQLWASVSDCKLLAVDKNGNISKVIDVAEILKADCTITSKLTTARAREVDEDMLLFGIHVPNATEEFTQLSAMFGVDVTKETQKHYVIAIDTPENAPGSEGMPVVFMIPTPEDTQVFGQIIGFKRDDGKSQLVVFSQTEGQFGKIFTIS